MPSPFPNFQTRRIKSLKEVIIKGKKTKASSTCPPGSATYKLVLNSGMIFATLTEKNLCFILPFAILLSRVETIRCPNKM